MADSSDRIALPIRVHEFLLACAGRIDDDALTDARELLAVAELDRAIELLSASLVAGRIPLTADERDQLRDLVDAVRSAPALVDRVIVNDSAPAPRHRFTAGLADDPAPDAGVAEAVGRVVEVLPDIRSLSCVWRTTPAGVPSGSVPHRLVLVETGPSGFAPSTAYRVEQALRRAGIRASVEVITAGSDVTSYHADALAVARRISLRQVAGARPAEAAEAGESGSLFADPPAPRPVTTTRRRAGAHAEKRPPDTASGRWQQRIAAADGPEPAAGQAEPVSPTFEPAPRQRHEPAMAAMPPTVAPPVAAAASPPPVSAAVPVPPSPSPSPSPAEPAPPTRQSTHQAAHQATHPPMAPVERPAERAPEVKEAQAPSAHGPGSVRAMQPVPQPVPDVPAAQNVRADQASADQPRADQAADAAAEADLSNRERELLRQLHEELAKREQAEPVEAVAPKFPPVPLPPAPAGRPDSARPDPGSWQVDRTGQRHSAYTAGSGGWQHAAEQTAVNGIPPYGSQPG